MEGTYCNLPALVALREKYKYYLFVDEAHSIGALGANGRGICEYYNIDPNRVDILMGTLTKSFGAAGGYVSGDRKVIERLRLDITSNTYGESMPPAVLQQIATSMRIIAGELNGNEGKERLQNCLQLQVPQIGIEEIGLHHLPVPAAPQSSPCCFTTHVRCRASAERCYSTVLPWSLLGTLPRTSSLQNPVLYVCGLDEGRH